MIIRIGDVTLSFKGAWNDGTNNPCYKKFFSKGKTSPHLIFESSSERLPDKKYKNRFNTPGLWSIDFNNPGDFCIELRGINRRPVAYVKLYIKEKKGLIYVESNLSDLTTTPFSPLPFRYPVDEVIFMNILPLYRGILLHASGVNDNGKGYIFSGFSRAGKSTMAKQWLDIEGVKILNDDRIIVRESRKIFYAYGTPWHGELENCEAERVRPRALFFIKHGRKNSIRSLSLSEAASWLIARSFSPFWDREGMQRITEVAERFVRKVPCYELSFIPNRSVVKYIRSLNL